RLHRYTHSGPFWRSNDKRGAECAYGLRRVPRGDHGAACVAREHPLVGLAGTTIRCGRGRTCCVGSCPRLALSGPRLWSRQAATALPKQVLCARRHGLVRHGNRIAAFARLSSAQPVYDCRHGCHRSCSLLLSVQAARRNGPGGQRPIHLLAHSVREAGAEVPLSCESLSSPLPVLPDNSNSGRRPYLGALWWPAGTQLPPLPFSKKARKSRASGTRMWTAST